MTSGDTFPLSERGQPISLAAINRENQKMNILGWLLGRTPADTDPPPPIKGKQGEIVPAIGRDETIDRDAAQPLALRYTLEPFFWMIEYEDSHGDITQRRVTMRCVEERGGQRYLYAHCHERNALRMFRLDRISCLISPDGEVEEAGAWFDATLGGCEIAEFTPTARGQGTKPLKADLSTYTTLKRHIAPGMILLTAAARSDNILHPREIDRILRFAEDCAFDLRDTGKLPYGIQGDDFDKLERTVRRLRPLTSDVEEAFVEISNWPRDRTKHLFNALKATALADGIVDEIEVGFMEALRNHALRQHGIGWDE